MKATLSKKAKPSKVLVKVKALSPQKQPKGGRKGRGDCDEFGCGGNHNDVVVLGDLS